MGWFDKKKKEEFKVPLERPSLHRGDLFPKVPDYEPVLSRDDALDIPIRKPTTVSYEETRKVGGPLFIKINKYKTVIRSMSSIKEKIKQTEEVLKKLNENKSAEDRELEQWNENLAEIKELLLDIDNKLFEV